MALIYNGKELPCDIRIQDWYEHGLEFKPGDGHNYKRKKAPYLLVYHWTGGERGNRDIYNTLKKRDYGIHFTIDYNGTVYQHCDPALVVCAHAGRANSYTIGVEIQNRGFPKRSVTGRNRGAQPHDNLSIGTINGKHPRTLYDGVIRGEKLTMCAFTLSQLYSAIVIADSFVAAGIIEQQVPRALGLEKGICDVVQQETILPEDRPKLRGVCGHFHLSTRKWDPGIDLLETFIAAGY